jgi:hypothetical protein
MEVEPTNNARNDSSPDSDREVTDHRGYWERTKYAHGHPQIQDSQSKLQGIVQFPAAAFEAAFESKEMDIIPAKEAESIETIKSRFTAAEWESIITEETCKLMDEDVYGPYQELYPGIIEYIIANPLPTQNIEKQKRKNEERDRQYTNRGEPSIDELNALINITEGLGNIDPDTLDRALARQTIQPDQPIGEYQGHGYLRENVEVPRGYHVERAQDPDDLKAQPRGNGADNNSSDTALSDDEQHNIEEKTDNPVTTTSQTAGTASSCIIS